MIDRSVFIHGGLAIAATALAAGAWLKPAGIGGDDGDVELISGKTEDAKEIRWDSEDYALTIARADPRTQIAITSKREKLQPPKPGAEVPAKAGAPDASTPATGDASTGAAGASATATPKAKVYPATVAADDLFKRMVPFHASRDLGAIDKDKLAPFGLEKPLGKLTLRLGDKEHTLDVGSATFGGGSTYIRASDGHVYLARSALFSELSAGGTSLSERNVVAAAPDKIERVTIRSGGKSRDLVHRSADDPAKSFFADPADPKTRLPQATSWVERLMRLRMVDFSDMKPAGEPAVVAEFYGDRKQLATVRLFTPAEKSAIVEGTGYAEPMIAPKPLAEALIKDVEAVLSESP
jgi:hypothetical protein